MNGNLEIIEIDDRKLSKVLDFIERNSNNIDYLVDSSQTTFGPLKRTGIFSKGITNVEKGYSEMQQSMKKSADVLITYYNALEAMENELIAVVESIKVPTDYRLNSAFSVSGASKTQLTKEDGKSINKENDFVDLDEVLIGQKMEQEQLRDILNQETKEVAYDDASDINKENLENIVKDEDLDVKEVDTESAIGEAEILKQNNTEADTEIRDIDEKSHIQRQEQLQEMNDNVIPIDNIELKDENIVNKIEKVEEEEDRNENKG